MAAKPENNISYTNDGLSGSLSTSNNISKYNDWELLKNNYAVLVDSEYNLVYLSYLCSDFENMAKAIIDKYINLKTFLHDYEKDYQIPNFMDLLDFSDLIGKGSKLEHIENVNSDFIIHIRDLGIKIDSLKVRVNNALKECMEEMKK